MPLDTVTLLVYTLLQKFVELPNPTPTFEVGVIPPDPITAIFELVTPNDIPPLAATDTLLVPLYTSDPLPDDQATPLAQNKPCVVIIFPAVTKLPTVKSVPI